MKLNKLSIGSAILGLALASTAALAQVTPQVPATTPAAPAAPAAPKLPSSPVKIDLAQRLVAMQSGSLDGLSRNLVETPARQMLSAAEPLIVRVPAEKREAAAKQIQADARKYVDETYPIVRKRAGELSNTQLQTAIEEKFTEDELRQIVAFLESPANKKLQQTLPEVSNALAQKLVADTRPSVEPRIKALEASIAKQLGMTPNAAAPASGPAGSGLKPAAPKPAAPKPSGSASKP
ncbi:DUF2059 domain-containing protein [Rivibacter subsaxonicus]|nr:DUF2059 domain-containing protein [Rivibacter subsaxonicus]